MFTFVMSGQKTATESIYFSMGLDSYRRINDRTGHVEHVSIRSGRLVRLTLLDDVDTVPCRPIRAKVGLVHVSANIGDVTVAYLSTIDTATFLPCTEPVKSEICSLVGEGHLVTELYKRFVARLRFPPFEVIKAWAEADKDFQVALVKAKRHAARVRFDQALSTALENKDDPKTLKTLVDILKRHAEIDDPETFQIKSDGQGQIVAPVINIITGVPQREEVIVNGEESESTRLLEQGRQVAVAGVHEEV
jgi:hypothetical protein